MTNRVGRGRGSRGAHLEFLEERALLSVAVVPHPPAHVAAVSPSAKSTLTVVFKGTITGSASPYSNPKYPVLNTQITGSGNVLGSTLKVALGGYQHSTLSGTKATVTNGIAVFKFSSLGHPTLTVTYSGGGVESASKPTQSLTFSGKIVAGVGTFAGATGTFSATVVLNPKTGAFTLNYTLSVTLKH